MSLSGVMAHMKISFGWMLELIITSIQAVRNAEKPEFPRHLQRLLSHMAAECFRVSDGSADLHDGVV